MTEDDKNSLVPRKNGDLIHTTGGGRVLSQMVEGALERVRARERALRDARFRVGEYELREPDYRQILRWSEELDLSPEDVVARLAGSRSCLVASITLNFLVLDGHIRSLILDSANLPLEKFVWEDGLALHNLALQTDRSWARLPGDLPSSLQRLICEYSKIEEIDLSGIPLLTSLACAGNRLTALNLASIPRLTELDCDSNRLTKLDLRPVGGLTELACGFNRLTSLDLVHLPSLERLWCSCNRLSTLDLLGVPSLQLLYCSDNALRELKLSFVTELLQLDCSDNMLSELDLSSVSGLTDLECRNNQLTKLDLSPVPELTTLDCTGNALTQLDIRPLNRLDTLSVDRTVVMIGSPPFGCKVTRR